MFVDFFIKRPILAGVLSIVIFLVGSALCGLSQNMTELIAFRALQGLGAGGLIVTAIAVIGDVIPPRERGRCRIPARTSPVGCLGGGARGEVQPRDRRAAPYASRGGRALLHPAHPTLGGEPSRVAEVRPRRCPARRFRPHRCGEPHVKWR